MNDTGKKLSTTKAAKCLGVSIKALRLYESKGLVVPKRSPAGYRMYSPSDMIRATEVATLRSLGLSLTQVLQVLNGDSQALEVALIAHESLLKNEIQQLMNKIDSVQHLRSDLAKGLIPDNGNLTNVFNHSRRLQTSFSLPWPWAGELFELRDIRPLNYIIGSLGSGKTQFACQIADSLPNATFLGLERLEDGNRKATIAQLSTDIVLKHKVQRVMTWLTDEGATESEALTVLLVNLEAEGSDAVVVDMVEKGLDHTTQEAVINYLRNSAEQGYRPLFLMTRSSAILELTSVGQNEAIYLCPANHNPPFRVAPYPEAPGYESVEMCLALPEVRSRTQGMIAWIPKVAEFKSLVDH
ncbi:MAG: MerR family transcriptional regulator [Methylophilaceae bacterium]|nr:MerR family transcriptional regulator [Methyloradius sp.]